MKTTTTILFVILTTSLFSKGLDMDYYVNIYDEYRNLPQNLILMKHHHVVEELKAIKTLNNAITIEKVGSSVEDRSIHLVSFGQGKTKILLWSQMHGDEPTATAALLALYKYFAKNIDDPFVQKLQNKLSIHSLIMLNPDGAERFKRRNAFDIDINRDANDLQTPEGRILKKMQERIKPDYGFNLHNMGGRETVEGSDEILKIALMAPPYNKENDDNEVRIKAKRLTVHIKNVLDKYIKGHVAKYKADYMPRAFGDAMQFWGVSTVLIETGSYTGEDPIFLEKLNFVSYLSVFDLLANEKLEEIDYREYDKIPLEGRTVFDILIKNALIVNGMQEKSFVGDIGINIDYSLKNGKLDTIGYIKDIGDLNIYNGKKIIDARNYVVTPGFIGFSEENVNKNQLIKSGITTAIQKQKDNPRHYLYSIHFQDIPITEIPKYTAEAAKKYNLSKKGKIERQAAADLLIFENDGDSVLKMEKLKYVMVNGILKKSKK